MRLKQNTTAQFFFQIRRGSFYGSPELGIGTSWPEGKATTVFLEVDHFLKTTHRGAEDRKQGVAGFLLTKLVDQRIDGFKGRGDIPRSNGIGKGPGCRFRSSAADRFTVVQSDNVSGDDVTVKILQFRDHPAGITVDAFDEEGNGIVRDAYITFLKKPGYPLADGFSKIS